MFVQLKMHMQYGYCVYKQIYILITRTQVSQVIASIIISNMYTSCLIPHI